MGFQPHVSFRAVLELDEPASDRAYRAVLDAVASAATPPGELITEGEVAERLGMSRTPVREAFLRLAGEGVLQLYPKRGAVVSPMTDREVRHLLDTRLMFETTAVRWRAEQPVTDDLREVLAAHLAEQDAGNDDPLAFARADRALHEAVVAGGGNPIASGLFVQTGPRLLRVLYGVAARDESTRRRVVREHKRLVGLVLKGDADGYASTLVSHVKAVHHVY
jgi:DNA-binding GntR family transcriptional regulator